MVLDRVVLLKKETTLKNGLEFKIGTEFHIVMDVVYMHGFPLPRNVQATIYNWIKDNSKLFKEIYR